jgi:hypothetical protein
LSSHERNPNLEYRPGFLALGCLLPVEGDLYLRSPGMALTPGTGPELASSLAEGLQRAEEGPGPGIAIETFLAIFVHRSRPPRRVLPTGSPQEARALLEEFQEVMEERGLIEWIPPEEIPDELREEAGKQEGTRASRILMDEPLAEWVGALNEQARATKRRAHRTKGKKGKAKKKRR